MTCASERIQSVARCTVKERLSFERMKIWKPVVSLWGEKMYEKEGSFDCFWTPIYWFKMLANETHWSFVFGVLVVYGISQGLGGAFNRVGTDYYMKDVQKESFQFPWLVKPLWGLLTDVLPILGYRRRPYFIFAGLLGVVSMLLLSFHENLHIAFALLSLTAGSAGAAIADVTIDACVAQNSNTRPSLAADMQSLCALSSSIGALMGFSLSGIFVHLIGPKGVFGLLSIPAGLVFLVGILLDEPFMPNFSYRQGNVENFEIPRCVETMFLYVLIHRIEHRISTKACSTGITDSKGGPSFSQETVGFIFSIGFDRISLRSITLSKCSEGSPISKPTFLDSIAIWFVWNARFDAGAAIELEIRQYQIISSLSLTRVLSDDWKAKVDAPSCAQF
ncbi:hypothetical protein NC653_038879 [Populus alba x Populus x berolinensis]|uniref:Folate-biopterin transporter 2 n=1 Tax=Populus alba x Populus x berolinensis TaxID=444605 RepID=A0AAD6L9Y3_9ROSI|nr:hypothetical protein NC653_038879 [Populus alba x Populus x berolinensis]